MGSPAFGLVLRRRTFWIASMLVASAVLASAARAADRIYWGNEDTDEISFANLDGSGGGNVNTTGATPGDPLGVTLDVVGGRVYWANYGSSKISFANLDGSGGGDLNTTGATVTSPEGIAVDPVAGRIYWANPSGQISVANLDGSGGGSDLNTTGATATPPRGIAVDPVAGQVYWGGGGSNKISFANLNGSGGGDIATLGATVNSPEGVAVDPVAGRIYWTNYGGNKISFAKLNGSDAGDLTTTGATVNQPRGLAVDAAAGRIYWANSGGDKISFANLDGSGGGDLTITGTTPSSPDFPALLKAPGGTGAPGIGGGSTVGSTLSCSQGSWATDLLPAFLYRAPRSFAYQWSLGGADIAGATASSYTASAPGDYRCAVTASNQAGGTSQTSAVHTVPGGATPAFGARTLVTLKLAASRIPATGPLKVTVANANDFAITGKVSGQTVNRVTVSRKRRVKLKAKTFRVGAQARKTVRLRLPKSLRRVLRRKRKLSLRLTATVTDPAGNTRTVRKRVSPKLKVKRRR